MMRHLFMLGDLVHWLRLGGSAAWRELRALDDRSQHPIDVHYFHMDAWACRRIFNGAPVSHVDVGSRPDTLAHIAARHPVTMVDLRPLPLPSPCPGLAFRQGSVLDLPYPGCSLPSLSSLHVLEHIGLGRYGDPIDPAGMKKACAEMARVLAPGGRLYVAFPVGRPRTVFNAHRVTHPAEAVRMFPGLTLLESSFITTDGRLYERADPAQFVNEEYACGMYVFTR